MRSAGSVLGALSVWTAALGLAWVAIVLIALAVAGLIRQVRELRAVVIEGFGHGFLTGLAPAALRPRAGSRDAVVLVVEPASASQELLDSFGEAVQARGGQTEARLLAPVAMPDLRVPANVTTAVDAEIVQLLRVPWTPALVDLGADGAVLDAAPVGSLDVLPKVLGRFEQPHTAAT